MMESEPRRRPLAALIIAAALCLSASAYGQCAYNWVEGFGVPGLQYGSILAATVFDDGRGPALYVAGNFRRIGGVAANHIARWDGQYWSALGEGLAGAPEPYEPYGNALTVFDDGSGRALYVGGQFTLAGGVSAPGVARWNGTSWSAVGSGISGQVYALAVFNDRSGPALYAGGTFGTIRKWSGATWSVVAGVHAQYSVGNITAMAAHDDGRGEALYVGGGFDKIGDVSANGVAKFDGTTWSPMSTGTVGAPYAFATFDDGGGPALYAGGSFWTAGGTSVNKIARWDGASWHPLGTGVSSPWAPAIHALTVWDDGNGPALYACGRFSAAGGTPANNVAKWNGSTWSAVGAGVNNDAYALVPLTSGLGAGLYTGGLFSMAGGQHAPSVARWDGASWSGTGDGATGGYLGMALTLATAPDSAGTALYVGGWFTSAGGVGAYRFARWDSHTWSGLGGGTDDDVLSLEAFDEGGGPALYAGGDFSQAGEAVSRRIARWDGAAWSDVGGGMDGGVEALRVFDDGGGPALYAGGYFTHAGGISAPYLARWDGAQWFGLSSALNGSVAVLCVWDDGRGPALYAGGSFTTARGRPAARVARWDGLSWSALGNGLSGGSYPAVYALTVWDDGSGPALYAAGNFTTAGEAPATNIAKWDGVAWTSLGAGTDGAVYALSALDDGMGAALYAGGRFTQAGGVSATNIAKWDGQTWSSLGAGIADGVTLTSVYALTSYDDGHGPALYIAGEFGTAGDKPAHNIAEWARARARGDMNCDGLINNQDIDGFIDALFGLTADYDAYLHSFDVYRPCDMRNADFSGDGLVNAQDIDGFIEALFQ